MTHHGKIGKPCLLREDIQPPPCQCEKTGGSTFRPESSFCYCHAVIGGEALEHPSHSGGRCQIRLHVHRDQVRVPELCDYPGGGQSCLASTAANQWQQNL